MHTIISIATSPAVKKTAAVAMMAAGTALIGWTSWKGYKFWTADADQEDTTPTPAEA